MAQYDFGTDIDPDTTSGPALADMLEDFRDALHSSHKGSSPPSYAVAGMLWCDDTATPWAMKVYDGTDWIIIGYVDTSANVYLISDEAVFADPADLTKRLRMNTENIGPGNTRVVTWPNQNVTISAAGAALIDDADAEAQRATMGANNASNLTTGTLNNDRVSATLPANKAFRRGNILATVTESSGTPTGGLIERGSGANGEFVRFADGTQICTHAITLTFDSISTLQGSWTFPAAFAADPIVTGIVRAASMTPNNSSLGLLRLGGLTTTSATFQQFRIISQTNFGGGDTITLHVTANGRWF